MLEDLVRRLPYLDRFIAFPGYPGLAEQFFDARRTLKFFQQMQAEHFDLAIQMQGSGVYSNPFVLMLGARMTVGFVRTEDPPGRLDAALPFPQEGHEVLRVLTMAEFLGASAQGEATDFPLSSTDQAAACMLLKDAQPPLIGLHPAARALTRRWPLERFAAAGSELRQRFGGTLVLLGEEEEHLNAERVLQLAGGPGLNLAGRTSLPELGAVLQHLAVLLTNDTGPAHIAYALNIPTVTLFGGEDPRRYGALQPGPFQMLVHDVACRPCDYVECPIGYVCLENLTVEQAVAAAEKVIRVA